VILIYCHNGVFLSKSINGYLGISIIVMVEIFFSFKRLFIVLPLKIHFIGVRHPTSGGIVIMI